MISLSFFFFFFFQYLQQLSFIASSCSNVYIIVPPSSSLGQLASSNGVPPSGSYPSQLSGDNGVMGYIFDLLSCSFDESFISIMSVSSTLWVSSFSSTAGSGNSIPSVGSSIDFPCAFSSSWNTTLEHSTARPFLPELPDSPDFRCIVFVSQHHTHI